MEANNDQSKREALRNRFAHLKERQTDQHKDRVDQLKAKLNDPDRQRSQTRTRD